MCEFVGESSDQRCLRPDDHQLDLVLGGKGDETSDVIDPYCEALRQFADPRIAGCGK